MSRSDFSPPRRCHPSAKSLAAALFILGLSGCVLTYTTSAYFGDRTAATEIDLITLVDTARMQMLADTAGVSRLLLYHYAGLETEADTALAHVVSMRNTAYELLGSDLLPDMELFLLHVPKNARLFWEQKYREPHEGEVRTFGTARYPLPYKDAPHPSTDFYYQPATYVLTHEMVELALVNELGNINHDEGCRWFFEGTANYAAQSWQMRRGVPRAERDRRGAVVWLWLLGDDLLEWGEHEPDELSAGYYAASTQAVTNLIEFMERRGIDEPIQHIIERTGPRRSLPEVIRDVTGRSFLRLFRVADEGIEPIKAELFEELESDEPFRRDEALELLQRMSDRLSDEERDRIEAAARRMESGS